MTYMNSRSRTWANGPLENCTCERHAPAKAGPGAAEGGALQAVRIRTAAATVAGWFMAGSPDAAWRQIMPPRPPTLARPWPAVNAMDSRRPIVEGSSPFLPEG